MRSWPSPVAIGGLAVVVLVAGSCSTDSLDDGSATRTTTTSAGPVPGSPTSAIDGELLVAEGSFILVAAASFEDPGFHQVVTLDGVTTDELAAGRRIVVRLYDAGRTDQQCDSEHPLSGCATVDWSDSENRPSVPPGGVFDNRLSFTPSDGRADFFLSESGQLAAVPDQFDPG